MYVQYVCMYYGNSNCCVLSPGPIYLHTVNCTINLKCDWGVCMPVHCLYGGTFFHIHYFLDPLHKTQSQFHEIQSLLNLCSSELYPMVNCLLLVLLSVWSSWNHFSMLVTSYLGAFLYKIILNKLLHCRSGTVVGIILWSRSQSIMALPIAVHGTLNRNTGLCLLGGTRW